MLRHKAKREEKPIAEKKGTKKKGGKQFKSYNMRLH